MAAQLRVLLKPTPPNITALLYLGVQEGPVLGPYYAERCQSVDRIFDVTFCSLDFRSAIFSVLA